MKCFDHGLIECDDCITMLGSKRRELEARIAELEAERETWGNEFNAVIAMKEQLRAATERVKQLENWQCREIELNDECIRLTEENARLTERVAQLEKDLHTRWLVMEKLQADYDEANEGLHAARAKIGATSEDVCIDIGHLLDEHTQLRDALEELVGIVDGYLEEDRAAGIIDSFTTQPGRIALKECVSRQAVPQTPEVALGSCSETLQPSSNRAGETNEGCGEMEGGGGGLAPPVRNRPDISTIVQVCYCNADRFVPDCPAHLGREGFRDEQAVQVDAPFSKEAENYVADVFPCEPPCDTFGLCSNCHEKLCFGAGYNLGYRAAKATAQVAGK